VLRRIQGFLNNDNDPEADTFLLCYSGHGSRDGGKWCCDDNSYVTFEQVIDLWQVRLLRLRPSLVDELLQKSAASRDGHRLILYVDACFSGHWAIKAKQMSLLNVIVQTSCSDSETSLDGVFTKAFVDYQKSHGAVKPSSQQLYCRTPFVYVPWTESEGGTIIFKDNKGKANRSRPYIYLLFDPDTVGLHRLDRRTTGPSLALVTGDNWQSNADIAQEVVSAEADRRNAQQTSQNLHQTTNAPNKSTAAGIQWAATHVRPNEDLSITGSEGGWPPGLFGPERSRSLIAMGITTFSQLMLEVKSSQKEEFYKTFGACDGKIGALGTAANVMWEVCMAWDYSESNCQPQTPGGSQRAAAVTPVTTQKRAVLSARNPTSVLNELMKQMQIDVQILRKAAAGKVRSQGGLNIPDIKKVLGTFDVDNDGSTRRADLDAKLSCLLNSMGLQ
jgi:hypothetical protein